MPCEGTFEGFFMRFFIAVFGSEIKSADGDCREGGETLEKQTLEN
jgi:hypothetical protein